MTNAELKAQIDLDITSATGVNSVTTTDVGGNMKDIVDYVDQEVDKGLVVLKVAQSGTANPTLTVKKNNTNLTFTATRVSAGVYNITPSSSVLTDVNVKVFFNSASFLVANYTIDNLGLFFQITVRHWTGSNFAVADEVINGAYIEIETFS